jgi:predicted lactoylglutathione lyase
MAKLIFVNLPVADLARSITFYEAVGAKRNPQFSDDTAACMVLSETIHVMLLTHAKFALFTAKPIADAHASTEVLICVSCDDRAAVDAMTEAALAHGGREIREPQDHGFMYGRAFEDPDGHVWEPMWMDMAALGDRPAGEVVAEAGAA